MPYHATDLHIHHQCSKRETLARVPDHPVAACISRVGGMEGGDLSNVVRREAGVFF
ncbi:MAG: hypothetical protein ACXVI0_09325 [Halobacteriota archaeon]